MKSYVTDVTYVTYEYPRYHVKIIEYIQNHDVFITIIINILYIELHRKEPYVTDVTQVFL